MDGFRLFFKYLVIGNGIVGRITAPFSFLMMAGTFLKVFGVNLSGKIVLLGGAVFAIGISIVGYVFDVSGMYRQEQDFDYKRNPIMNEIKCLREEIKLIKN